MDKMVPEQLKVSCPLQNTAAPSRMWFSDLTDVSKIRRNKHVDLIINIRSLLQPPRAKILGSDLSKIYKIVQTEQQPNIWYILRARYFSDCRNISLIVDKIVV